MGCLQVLVVPCVHLLAFRTLERSRMSSAKDLTLPHWLCRLGPAPHPSTQGACARASRNSWPSWPTHCASFCPFSATSAGDLEAVRTILPLTTRRHLCVHRPSRIHSRSQQLFPQPCWTACRPVVFRLLCGLSHWGDGTTSIPQTQFQSS